MAPARSSRPSVSVLPQPQSPSLPSANNNNNTLADLPPISAIFLIDFDVKAGYTIVWKRAVPGLELDGLVEYKSLPSGLHTVTDDLIYFVHEGGHAGLSAFVNEPCEEAEARHARMIAVGILVPLSYGRLGRGWRHAQGLKEMAAKLAKDRSQTDMLQKYWEANEAKPDHVAIASPSPTQDRKTPSRNRSVSDGTSLLPPEHKLSPYHPAWSLTSLLDKFGPLIFPIQRAALLRKRILISCHAPVHQTCDFVYDISILSNVPFSVADTLPLAAPVQRLRPLFNIGVHDIPFLAEDLAATKRHADGELAADDESGSGWIACTTDSILAMKDTLWDMLITMPPEHSSGAKEKAWPVVECPRGSPIKATQRDLRRFNALRAGLARLAASAAAPAPESPQSEGSAVRLSASQPHSVIKDEPIDGADKLVEPASWASLAYNGYMWWASAGEQLRSDEQEESAQDAALLADFAPASHASASMSGSSPLPDAHALTDSVVSLAGRRTSDDGKARVELAIIAYFHRLTSQMLSVLVDIVESADEAYPDDSPDEIDDADADEAEVLLRNGLDGLPSQDVTVDSRSVESMGLDVWSASDIAFVKELTQTYFDRTASIESKGVEVCGVRVC